MIELLWGTWGFSSAVSLCSLMKEVHDGDLIHSLSSTTLDVLGPSAIRSGWLSLYPFLQGFTLSHSLSGYWHEPQQRSQHTLVFLTTCFFLRCLVCLSIYFLFYLTVNSFAWLRNLSYFRQLLQRNWITICTNYASLSPWEFPFTNAF